LDIHKKTGVWAFNILGGFISATPISVRFTVYHAEITAIAVKVVVVALHRIGAQGA
jgi:hypothetical protein